MVSLGTGELTRRLPYDEVKDWGAARWAQPTFALMCDGICDAVDYQLQQLLPSTPDGMRQYYRFQARLDVGNDDMDDASNTNIRVLKLLAEDMLQANRATLRAFSELWYRKAPRRQRGAIQNITAFYQVLDLFGDWNRVYGSRGFLQYQFLVPFGAETTLRRLVQKIGASRHASGLNVLKRFGAGNQAPLSFPQPGWTITVDFPIEPGLHRFCDELDELVLEAGGRLYLAKESRTTGATFKRGYPRFEEWRKVREAVDPDRVFVSDMARRLELSSQ